MNNDMTAHLALLRELVSIESVFPNERRLSGFMREWLTAHGFMVEEVMTDGTRPSLVATLGQAERYLGFYGHLDTVPPDPRYERDPFTVEVRDDLAYGLGVADMKGGNSSILMAARWAASERYPVKIVFGVDEEDYSRGAHALVESGLLGDIGCLIVAESGQVEDPSSPFSVGFGRKGRIVCHARIHGSTSHAAVATPQSNAIHSAARFVRSLEALRFPEHPHLGSTRVVCHSIRAETDSFSAPGECSITFSLLTTPGVTSGDALEALGRSAAAQGIRVTVELAERPTPFGEAYETPRDHPFVRYVEAAILAPSSVKPAYFSSVADENVLANRLRIPVLTIGPVGGGDHTKDEWLRISSMVRVTEVYASLVAQWNSLYATMAATTA